MISKEFLTLHKDDKISFVSKTQSKKKDKGDKKVYFIEATACCGENVEWDWGKAPETCPNCASPFWNKPAAEFFLFEAQERFCAAYPDTRILGEEMFPLIVDYAKNLIQGMLRGKVCISENALDEKANDAATALIEVILKDKNHRMEWSFGSYLSKLCRSVMYNSEKINDQTYSLDAILGDSEEDTLASSIIVESGSIELEKGLSEYTRKLENKREKETVAEDIVTKIDSLVEKSCKAIWVNTRKTEDSLLFLLGMNLRFKNKNDKAVLDFYEIAGSQSKRFVESGELLVFNMLRSVAT